MNGTRECGWLALRGGTFPLAASVCGAPERLGLVAFWLLPEGPAWTPFSQRSAKVF